MKRNQTIKKFASMTLAATLVMQSTSMAVAIASGELDNTYQNMVIEETYETAILPELSEEIAVEEEHVATVMPELGEQKPVEDVKSNTYEAQNDLYEYEVINDETIKITKYNGSEASVTVPSKIEGKSVTEIGGNAFRIGNSNNTAENTDLVSVIIPEGVTKIDGSAFYLCTKLETVSLPSTLTTFGNNVFYKCTSLKTINIPEGITTIGNHMFYGCTSLTSIDLPASLTTIGNYAFWGCTSLKEIVIPGAVTTIGESAFQNCKLLKEIIVPKNVTEIGESAFSLCDSLEKLEIEGEITEIPQDMCRQNSKLKEVILPKSVTSIGEASFMLCSSLESINIHTGVTEIGNFAFRLSGLKEIILPEGLTSIGDASFRENKELSHVRLPSTLKNLGNRAFMGCTSLENIVIPEGVSEYHIAEITNSGSVTKYGTFEGSGLTSITIKNVDTKVKELEKLIFNMPAGVVFTVENIEMKNRLLGLDIDEGNIKVVEPPVVEPPVVEPPVVNPPSSGGSSGGGGGSIVTPKPEVIPPVIESIEKLPTQDKEEIINNFVENVPYTSINSALTIEKLNELTAGKFTKEQLQELIDNPQLLKELGLSEEIYREQVTLKPIENPSFTDVSDTHWANDTIKRAAERGLVAGMPDGSFAPKQELQVTDTFAFLDRVLLLNGVTEMKLGRSTVEQYVTDTNHWAFGSMASVGSKLTESTLMTVSKLGNEPITRGLLAQILFEITNGNLDLSRDKIAFVDTKNHSYSSAIDYCVQVGLLVGTASDTMSPDKALTRAELMSIVVRLDDMLQA